MTSPVAYVFQTHAQVHKAFKILYTLNYLRRALNTPDERFGTERSTREYRLYILYRGRWEEGCGAYKADCPSCIPSRLLGILSPHPLFFTRARDDSLFLSRTLASSLVGFSRRSCAVYRDEQYSPHLNILRAVSRVAIRMLHRCCRKS